MNKLRFVKINNDLGIALFENMDYSLEILRWNDSLKTWCADPDYPKFKELCFAEDLFNDIVRDSVQSLNNGGETV